MRKSNVIILAVLAVAAGFFLWLWYYLGFNFVDDPFDLVLAVVWWAVVVALVVGIHAAERKRQRRVRTAYLAPGVLFNSEAGFVDLAAFEEGTTLVDALEHTLADLKYSFDRKDPADEGTAAPDGAVPSAAMAGGLSASDEAAASAKPRGTVRFERIVRTDKFDKGDAGKWEGEVVDVKTQEATPFKGKEDSPPFSRHSPASQPSSQVQKSRRPLERRGACR
ncbi:MAG: hypothetical protein V8S24_17045 [Gordonibacter pamelaeae]